MDHNHKARYLPAHLGHIELERLIPWGLNPLARTEDSAGLRDLIASLRDVGQAQPVVVVYAQDDYALIDGHRRLVAARALGWPTLWAMVYRGKTAREVPALVAVLNLQRQHYGLSEYLEGLRQGVQDADALLASLPPRYTKTIQRWLAVVPADELRPLLTVLTPYAIDQASAVCRYLGWPKGRQLDVLRWMSLQGAASAAALRHLLRAGIPASRLATAITEGTGLWGGQE